MKNHFGSCPKSLGPKYFCPGLNLFWTCIKMKLQIYRKVSIPLHIVALFMRKTANNAYCILCNRVIWYVGSPAAVFSRDFFFNFTKIFLRSTRECSFSTTEDPVRVFLAPSQRNPATLHNDRFLTKIVQILCC